MTRMDKAEMRRHALRHFFRAMAPRTQSGFCKAAGVAEGTVRDFLSGRNQSLEETTYEKLAEESGWTVAQIKGDALRRKNDNGQIVPSDTSNDVGHNSNRTTDSPESEGQMSQLRLEIVDKIWELPDDRLIGLKKHIEAIERAVADSRSRPHFRETPTL